MVVREGEVVDLLAAPEDLQRWLERERERLGDCTFAVANLEEIRGFRDAVRSLLLASAHRETPPSEAIERVNAASRAAPIALELEAGSDDDLQVVERHVGGGDLAQLLGRLARSAITVLTGPKRERLHMCSAPSCGMLFLGNRRWCTSMCGNRARVARHYGRKRA